MLFIAGVAGICPLRAGGTFAFTPNQGQWDSRISYQLEIPGGFMYLEKDGITCFFIDRPQHTHDEEEEHGHTHMPDSIKAHAFKSHFAGCNTNVTYTTDYKSSYYYNYFLGNDQSKWKSFVYSYETVTYHELYPGIDFTISTHSGVVKSEYIIKPGANANLIDLYYEGVSSMQVKNGSLIIKTSLGEVIEEKPVSWQLINGQKKMVKCNYVLKNNRVHFSLPENYDSRYPLIIDPELVFATLIGSVANNFGSTATYDNLRNTYAGTLVFSVGLYPTTFGAFQQAFGGTALTDMGLSKFNANGSNLIYSTYLGGTGGEMPHSVVVNSNYELFVLGTTGSSNYPVTTGAFDQSFNGGTSLFVPNQAITYSTGSDIVVAHFNASGSALLGSTYVGGSGNDGYNFDSLNFNYGDMIRGEIILDANENPVIASVTGSVNFPVTASAFQPVFGGGSTDACIFKMNPSLTSMIWCSFFGGNRIDASYGLQMDSGGNVFFTGGTTSPNLPVTPGAYDQVYGGKRDAFVGRINAAGNALTGCTYLGTSEYDQAFMVQLDNNDSVYVLGQSKGNYPVSTGIYSVANSGQFIHKLNNALTSSSWSTVIGRGVAGQVDISPTAFLISKCNQIFLCGWGGPLNGSGSSTNGLPITPNAIQTTTDGRDFWLGILAPNASSLIYGTYFGGPISPEHVDGGTSRFDKSGMIYQAVCAGCSGNSDFPTTPGVWSNQNFASCNMGIFKISLDVVAEGSATVITQCTIPATVNFINTSTNAVSFEWYFGDGNSSTSFQPTHQYSSPGIYDVMLIATDSNTCTLKDTFMLQVVIPPQIALSLNLVSDTLCVGDSVMLNASSASNAGITYTWSPNYQISDSTSATPWVSPDHPMFYTVHVADTNGCVDSQSVFVHVHSKPNVSFLETFTPCFIPAPVNMVNTSTGTSTYTWFFGDGNTANTTDAQHTYTVTGTYTISLVGHDESSCGLNDTMQVEIFLPPPANIVATGTDTVCYYEYGQLSASGGVTYQWLPTDGLTDPTSPTPQATNTGTTTYYVFATDANGCSGYDSATLSVFPTYSIEAGDDLLYDFALQAPVMNAVIPDSGMFYWTPSLGLSCTTCENPVATPENSTWYYLIYSDPYGCWYKDSVYVMVTPSLFIPNAFSNNGDGVNDYFDVLVRNLTKFEIEIFNRWGELIFASDDPANRWDGTYKGIKCPVDVYVWKVTYIEEVHPNETKTKYGHVSLLR